MICGETSPQGGVAMSEKCPECRKRDEEEIMRDIRAREKKRYSSRTTGLIEVKKILKMLGEGDEDASVHNLPVEKAKETR
jgi:hypothetical protein